MPGGAKLLFCVLNLLLFDVLFAVAVVVAKAPYLFYISFSLAMPPPCTDKHRFCKYWAARGHCHIKALYMTSNCPRSCNICEHGIYEISKAFKVSRILLYYYSTIMSFYHIRSREQAKYEAVIHRSVLV